MLFVTTTLGSHKQLTVLTREVIFLKLSTISGSYNLSTPSSTKNPDSLGKVCVIDIPFWLSTLQCVILCILTLNSFCLNCHLLKEASLISLESIAIYMPYRQCSGKLSGVILILGLQKYVLPYGATSSYCHSFSASES